MPVIPLLTKSAPIANAPAPVLDRERRPTVDTRGIQAATARLTEAGKMSNLPMSLANADGAIGSIGQAIARTGSVWAAAAEKEQEITERRVITTAQMGMQNTRSEFAAWKEDPANASKPETWAAKAQEMVSATMAPYLERKELGDNARKDLALMGEAWGKGFVNEATLQGRKAGNAILTENTLSLVGIDTSIGDYEGAAAKIQSLIDAGVMSEDVGKFKKHQANGEAATYLFNSAKERADVMIQAGDTEGARKEIDAVPLVPGYEKDIETRKAQANGNLTFVHERNKDAKAFEDLIASDLRGAQKAVNDPEQFAELKAKEPARFENLRKKMVADVASKGNEELTNAMNLIAANPDKVKAGTKIEDLGVKWDFASPMQRLVAEADLAKRNNQLSQDDPVKMHQLFAAATKVTRDSDPFHVAELETLVNQSFSPAYAKKILDEIELRFTDKVPPGFDITSISAPLQEMTEKGVFGKFKLPVEAEGGVLAAKDPKRYVVSTVQNNWFTAWWTGSPTSEVQTEAEDRYTPETVIDLSEKGKADVKMLQVEKGMMDAYKAGTIIDQPSLTKVWRTQLQKVGVTMESMDDIPTPVFDQGYIEQRGPTKVWTKPRDNATEDELNILPTGSPVLSPNPLLEGVLNTIK